MPHHPFDEFCPCGWQLGSTKPHNHAERLRKFWQERLAKNPPARFKRAKQRPSRHQKELIDAR